MKKNQSTTQTTDLLGENKSQNQSEFTKDSIYASALPAVEQFSFSKQVVNVFPDMINRSVPGYQTIVDGIGKLASKHCGQNALIYDLGCSLGSTSLSIARNIDHSHSKIIAIDNSSAMIERCQQHISAFNFAQCINPQVADINDLSFEPCQLIVLNFTLQFIERERRTSLMQKLYDALEPGGMLIVSEKIQHPNSKVDKLLVELHHQFKRDNGYSELEISQKRSALEDVMVLDTPEQHFTRLSCVGFSNMTTWFQHYNFLSLFCLKDS